MGATSETPSLQLLALVERADEVRAGRLTGRAVRLVCHDSATRLATLQSLYQRLVEHPRFGGAWPWALPTGALAPALPPMAFPGIPPRLFWFGLCAGGEPLAEPAQLCEQLDQLNRLPDLDEWVHRSASEAFPAVLLGGGPPLTPDRRAHAFAFLGGEPVADADSVTSAVRTLHGLTGGAPLLADGGVLQLDAAGFEARALVAAGWLERLARTALVVLAVDEAHLAGPFVTALVRTLLEGAAPVLAVLAGEPATGGDDDHELAGPLGAFGAEPAQPFSLPAGDAGYLAAALAAVSPSGLFAEEHVMVVAEAIGVGDDAAALHEELVAAGWLRPITRRVSGFGSARRHRAAAGQVTGMLGDELAARGAALCREAATRADDDALSRVLAAGAQGAAEGAGSDAAWHHALLLARAGEVARAARLGAELTSSPLRRAVVAAWRRGAADGDTRTVRGPADNDLEADRRNEAERRIVLAARLATTEPAAANSHLVAAISALDGLAGVDDGGRLSTAAARVFLTTGELDGLAHALGPDAPSWLPAAVVKRLVELHGWRQSHGVVAREVELALVRHAIDVLVEAVPASRAVALARLGLVELLERADRLPATEEAAAALVAAAQGALEAGHEAPPLQHWRARRWAAVVADRGGDAAGAVAALAALVDDQCAVVRADHPAVLETTLWLARVLLDAHRLDEAATAVQRSRRAIDATGRAETDRLRLTADQIWAGVLAARGHHPDAAELAASVVLRWTESASADDDDLLRARLLLGSELARQGRPAPALVELDEVVARRAVADRPDGRRLLAARHARAGCLVLLHRYADALGELDAVVVQRTRALPATDPALVSARCDRAMCLLMLQRWSPALADLEPALAVLHVRLAPDDERLLLARQQRAMCLHAIGRSTDAVAEFDGILAATATWPRDHGFLGTIQRQRAELGARAAVTGSTPRSAPP